MHRAMSIDALLLQQAHQENLLLREELAVARKSISDGVAAEAALRAALSLAEARCNEATAAAAAARSAAEEMETNLTQESRSRAAVREADAHSRAKALEAQLQACEASCHDRMTARLKELSGEVEHLRERCAVHEGTAQGARHDAHGAELRSQVATARAEQLQRALEEMREELARTIDEASAAKASADKAARSEAAAMEAAALREALLEKRAATAEERLQAAPAERDEAIVALKRAHKDLSSQLQERTTAIVTREVRLRMVAEERARLRALG